MYYFKQPHQYNSTDKKIQLQNYGPVKGSAYWFYLKKKKELADQFDDEAPSSVEEFQPPVSKQKWSNFIVEMDLSKKPEIVVNMTKRASVDGLCVEILRDRLYLYSAYGGGNDFGTKDFFNFKTEERIVYMPFHLDFGPHDIGASCRFIELLKTILTKASLAQTRIVFSCSPIATEITNSITLLSLFCMEALKMTPKEAYRPFRHVKCRPYRDASYGPITHEMTIMDVLDGYAFGKSMGWFDFKTFDVESYYKYETVDFGDMNIIIPGEIIAFSGPMDKELVWQADYPITTPDAVLPVLKYHGVSTVIRLNERQYDSGIFTDGGLDFHELYFPDGSCPPNNIVSKFIEIVDKSPGLVAVHCKAGLGRTGTLITCYAMLRYRAEARSFIGWMRLMRPGSVLGPQQEFLMHLEPYMHEEHDNQLKKNSKSDTQPPAKSSIQGSEVSVDKNRAFIHRLRNRKQADIAVHGDVGQGGRLMGAKNKKNNRSEA